MNFLTDFADQAVVLPLAVAIFVMLALSGWRRGAGAWVLCVGGVLAAMLILKLVIFACGWRLPWTGLSSPSGHTAAAAVVYGGLLSLLVGRSPAGTAFAALAGACMALMVGLTRLALHVHTVSDVVAGAAVGIAGVVALRRLAGPRPPLLRRPKLAAIVLAVLVIFHGRRMEAESRIRSWAMDVWPLSACEQSAPHQARQAARRSG